MILKFKIMTTTYIILEVKPNGKFVSADSIENDSRSTDDGHDGMFSGRKPLSAGVRDVYKFIEGEQLWKLEEFSFDAICNFDAEKYKALKEAAAKMAEIKSELKLPYGNEFDFKISYENVFYRHGAVSTNLLSQYKGKEKMPAAYNFITKTLCKWEVVEADQIPTGEWVLEVRQDRSGKFIQRKIISLAAAIFTIEADKEKISIDFDAQTETFELSEDDWFTVMSMLNEADETFKI
jgi:hypothetical protein